MRLVIEVIEVKFKPVLLASDINIYSMARAFHEEYNVKSLVLAKNDSGDINHSSIIEYEKEALLDEKEIFLEKMDEIYNRYSKNVKLILIGCADHYVRLIIENYIYLENKFILPYPKEDVLNNLVLKETFYKLCKKNNVDYPKTFVFKKGGTLNFKLNFNFPVILKPSDSVLYWKANFPNQHKVYQVDNREQLDCLLNKIYQAGYKGNMIVQDMVPGDDSNIYDLHVFCGKDEKVKYMNLGNVLLEEHTPKGIGSNAATITTFNEELMLKIKEMLETIKYQGWVDCDLKYDYRDDKIKIFEINIRQGRSNYRNTGAGYNVAKYIVEAFLYNKKQKFIMVREPYFWHVVPKMIVFKYVNNKEKLKEVKSLIKDGKSCHSLFYKKDRGIKRILYLLLKSLNHFRKFKKYCKLKHPNSKNNNNNEIYKKEELIIN